jgi:membrane protease subunit HflC
MITERNRIAAQYRSEGDEEALKLRSTTDKTVTILLSEANMDAETIRGEGDQEAARIFNEAYANNPEFFEFYNYLETYRVTIGQQAMLVIPLDSPFAKYLLGIPEKDLPAVIPSVQPAEEE